MNLMKSCLINHFNYSINFTNILNIYKIKAIVNQCLNLNKCHTKLDAIP